jgi:ribosomal protein S6--L-glutamate ligase
MGLELRIGTMKLLFMLARRNPPEPSQIVIEVSRILEGRGIRVSSQIAEETLTRPDVLRLEHDLFLLKSYTELSLTMAGVLHQAGARLLNPYPGCVSARNKIVAAQVLAKHGIPAPRCWVTSDLSLLREIVESTPLIIKPHMGWRGEGIQVVHNVRELDAVPPPSSPVLIQEYIQGSGEDLRLYAAGTEVFATRKPFSDKSFSVPGRAVSVTREMRDLARACGAAFGLGLFGVDIIETPKGPFVVDINYFPGYKGVPGAAEVVANYIDVYACAGPSGLEAAVA